MAGPPLHLSPVEVLDRWPLPAALAAYARTRDWKRAEEAREMGRMATLLTGYALVHGFDARARDRAERFEQYIETLTARARDLAGPEVPDAEPEEPQAASATARRFFAAARPLGDTGATDGAA